MITENYVLHSPKITCTTKIAFLSDLHGENPQGLERALDALAPDLIIVGGDLFDRRADNREALQLMEVITENCPCFYTPGNHELYVSDRKELYATLRNYGHDHFRRQRHAVYHTGPASIYGSAAFR